MIPGHQAALQAEADRPCRPVCLLLLVALVTRSGQIAFITVLAALIVLLGLISCRGARSLDKAKVAHRVQDDSGVQLLVGIVGEGTTEFILSLNAAKLVALRDVGKDVGFDLVAVGYTILYNHLEFLTISRSDKSVYSVRYVLLGYGAKITAGTLLSGEYEEWRVGVFSKPIESIDRDAVVCGIAIFDGPEPCVRFARTDPEDVLLRRAMLEVIPLLANASTVLLEE